MKDLNELSSQIIKAALTVHRELGPGLLESVYQSCMAIELNKMGLQVQSRLAFRFCIAAKECLLRDFG